MTGIQRIAVVGGGFMGGGIAQVAAQGGFNVTLIDVNPAALDKAVADMRESLRRLCAKGIVQEPAEDVLARITTASAVSDAASADVVIEAVFERIDVKEKLLGELEAICPAETMFATNTSTIPISLLADFTKRSDRLVGMHFFSPVPVNPLLEIIPGDGTSPATLETAKFLGERFGKTNYIVKKDVPGFIMNRLFGTLVCEAVRLVEQGVATVEDVDGGMTTGYGFTMGPLAIADLAGLDVCLMAFSNIQQLDPGCAIDPPRLLRQRVAEGKYGRKTGEGFYHYDGKGRFLGPAV